MYQQTDSDKLQGSIRTPIAQLFTNQRAFSGSVQTLAFVWTPEYIDSRFSIPKTAHGGIDRAKP